jgi:hypothetical protein
MDKTYYTYIYLDPRKRGNYSYPGLNMSFLYEPFYAGKGTGEKGVRCRRFAHISAARNSKKTSYFLNLIRKIEKNDFNMRNFVIKYNDEITELQSFETEETLIALIGRWDEENGPLTNKTDGGEGASGANKGMDNGMNKISRERRLEIGANAQKTRDERGTQHSPIKNATKRQRKEWAKKIAKIKKENGTMPSGATHGQAMKILITDPDGNTEIAHGTLRAWTDSKNFSYTKVYENIDKGTITKSFYKKHRNLIGWTFQKIS